MSAVVKLDVEKKDERTIVEFITDVANNIFDDVEIDGDLDYYHPDVLNDRFIECCLHNNESISEIDDFIVGVLDEVWRDRLRGLKPETQLLLLQVFGHDEMKHLLRIQ